MPTSQKQQQINRINALLERCGYANDSRIKQITAAAMTFKKVSSSSLIQHEIEKTYGKPAELAQMNENELGIYWDARAEHRIDNLTEEQKQYFRSLKQGSNYNAEWIGIASKEELMALGEREHWRN